MSKKIKIETNLKEVPIDAIMIILSYMTTKEFFIFVHYYIHIEYSKYNKYNYWDRKLINMKGKSIFENRFEDYHSRKMMELFDYHFDYIYNRVILVKSELHCKYEIFHNRIIKIFNDINLYHNYCSLCIGFFKTVSPIDENVCYSCYRYNKKGIIKVDWK
jgi:hypothetical protein